MFWLGLQVRLREYQVLDSRRGCHLLAHQWSVDAVDHGAREGNSVRGHISLWREG